MKRTMYASLLVALLAMPLGASAEIKTWKITLSDGSVGTFDADDATIGTSNIPSNFSLTRDGVTYQYIVDGVSNLFFAPPGFPLVINGPPSVGELVGLVFADLSTSGALLSFFMNPRTFEFQQCLRCAVDGSGTYTIELAQTPATLTGFFPPVDPLPVRNDARGGRTIPFKFYAATEAGAPITDLAGVTFVAAVGTCPEGPPVENDAIEIYATDDAGLQNMGGGFYQFNWKTPRRAACASVTLSLPSDYDADPLTAEFRLLLK